MSDLLTIIIHRSPWRRRTQQAAQQSPSCLGSQPPAFGAAYSCRRHILRICSFSSSADRTSTSSQVRPYDAATTLSSGMSFCVIASMRQTPSGESTPWTCMTEPSRCFARRTLAGLRQLCKASTARLWQKAINHNPAPKTACPCCRQLATAHLSGAAGGKSLKMVWHARASNMRPKGTHLFWRRWHVWRIEKKEVD